MYDFQKFVENELLKRSDDFRQCRPTQEKQHSAVEFHLFLKVDTFSRHLINSDYDSQRNAIVGHTMELTNKN
jgi:hypothetical protein